MKHFIKTAVVVSALAVASSHEAYGIAQLQLRIGDPGPFATLLDNGLVDVAGEVDAVAGDGIISFSGTVADTAPNFLPSVVTVAASATKPAVGSATSPVLNLSWSSTANGASELHILWTDV